MLDLVPREESVVIGADFRYDVKERTAEEQIVLLKNVNCCSEHILEEDGEK